MKYLTSSLRHGSILFAVSLSLFLFPPASFAVVGDVTLTGLPPNTTVSLTNEETKQTVEQKTDDRGFVVIPMTGKNWQSGTHSVTCQVDGKPVTSKIFLRDGVNRVDLTSLTYSARRLDPANAQKVDEALKKSSAALKADPKNSQALLTQGSALNRLGRHGQALSSLAQAAKLGSTHPALAFETGWSLLRLGMYREAIAQLEKYEKMQPGLGQTSEFIGRSHLYMNELDKADAKLKEAIQRDPRLKPTTLFHLAVLETLRKNPQAGSNHIGTLLKEAPNSPTAQVFKNALLQAPGAKPAAGAGAKDFKLSDPIRIQLPPTTAADVAGAVAKGVVGGLLGGLFGGGRRDEPEGPNLAAKPALPETTLASKDGKTKINLSGAIEDGKPYIVMGVKESPGNGAPHLILLQDKNCNVTQPKETSVTAIWEAWGGWKMSCSPPRPASPEFGKHGAGGS
ncbi:MAG: tetratricopeptide repeat protein [Deltaproteobacteria bacterium]|nr:tetratricopeptide repeat protein [Deltaproteobacteria bacterium]